METGNLEIETAVRNRLGRSVLRNPVLGILLLVIHGYRYFISPLMLPSCRFYPSCSNYAIKAVEKHGGLKGLYYFIRRIFKCHPFHTQTGYDPVP